MKERLPLARLMMQLNAARPARDFIGALRGAQAKTGKPGLIAEVKKASPSRGVIQPNFDPVRVRSMGLHLPCIPALGLRGWWNSDHSSVFMSDSILGCKELPCSGSGQLIRQCVVYCRSSTSPVSDRTPGDSLGVGHADCAGV